MSRPAGLSPDFDQDSARLAVVEPDVVRPLEPDPDGAGAFQRAGDRHAHAQAQGRARPRCVHERPTHRQGDAAAERRDPTATTASPAGVLQFAQDNIGAPLRRRTLGKQSRTGRIHVEQEVQAVQPVQPVAGNRSSNRPLLEQFRRVRQLVSAPRHGLDVDAQHAQALDALPDGCPAHAQHLRQPFTGMQPAVRQQHEQGRGVQEPCLRSK